ncbi:MAG: XTP/dITP diphosphatase [Verrucomicrobiota bacterium]
MKSLFIATRNAGKAREFAQILPDWEIQTLLDLPDIPDVLEDGATFEENAQKKALEISAHTESFVLADDSGLEVDILNGAPGVHSARYAGEPKNDARNLQKLLDELKTTPEEKRGAQFRCVLALAQNKKILFTVEGVCRGKIAFHPAGKNGFGYDPIFSPDGYTQTFAELSPDAKHRLSHRGKAISQLKQKMP